MMNLNCYSAISGGRISQRQITNLLHREKSEYFFIGYIG